MSAWNQVRESVGTAFGWLRLSIRTVLYAGTSATIGALLPGPRFSQWLFLHWCRATVRQVKVTIQLEGAEHVRDNQPCVLVANHLSTLDIPVLGAFLEGDYRWVAKREVFRIPFVGWHLWSAGHIPVDRRAGKSAIEALQRRFDDRIRRGASILLFPEGTRSRDGALQKFKMGAFHAAVRSDVALVPIVFDGTQALVKKGSRSLNPSAERVVRVRVLPPMLAPAEGTREGRARALRDEAREAMSRTLDELRGGSGASERPTL